MPDYEKMYHLLFNAITDALEQIEQQNLGIAKDQLISAQQKNRRTLYHSGELKKQHPKAVSEAMLRRLRRDG